MGHHAVKNAADCFRLEKPVYEKKAEDAGDPNPDPRAPQSPLPSVGVHFVIPAATVELVQNHLRQTPLLDLSSGLRRSILACAMAAWMVANWLGTYKSSARAVAATVARRREVARCIELTGERMRDLRRLA
jgi:hypothetical protein